MGADDYLRSRQPLSGQVGVDNLDEFLGGPGSGIVASCSRIDNGFTDMVFHDLGDEGLPSSCQVSSLSGPIRLPVRRRNHCQFGASNACTKAYPTIGIAMTT